MLSRISVFSLCRSPEGKLGSRWSRHLRVPCSACCWQVECGVQESRQLVLRLLVVSYSSQFCCRCNAAYYTRCNTAYYTRCSTIQVLRNVPLACGGDICYRPVFPRKIRTWIAALFVSVDLLGAIRSSRTRRSAAFVASFRWYPHAMEKFCRLLHFSNSPIITKMIHGTYLREGNWSFQVHGDISVVACVGFCSSSASFLRYR